MNSKVNVQSKKPQRLILVLVVVMLVLLIIVVVQKSRSTAMRHAYVTISQTGYMPREIKITKNTIVTWTNTDPSPHTVGANPYPSHNSLRSLASPSLAKGQGYSYTFNQPGTYFYHDDLNPTLNAKIVVQ